MNSPVVAVSDNATPFHPASSLDYLPIKQLRTLQSERLRRTVRRAYDSVSLYRQRMQKQGLSPEEIRGVEDLQKLPLTAKSDLADAYPIGMFAVPLEDVARLHPLASAPGKPIVLAYSKRDLETWTELIVRCLLCCGISEVDIIQNACGYHLFADGLGFHAGAERLGARVVPVSGRDADQQLAVMKDFGVSAVCAPAGYFLHLLDRAEKMNVDLRKLPLRTGAFMAEPWNEAIRRRIEESAGIKAYEIYSLPEFFGPGVGSECSCQDGIHIFEEHFYPEIVDAATGQPLPEGEEGELVLTTLTKEAMPMIRYRTPDRAALISEPCVCGRTLRRIRRIARRSDDVFVIQGVTVSPSQIEAAVLALSGTLPPYQIVLAQENGLEHLELEVEVTPQIFRDQVGFMESLQSKLAHEIEHTLGVRAVVRFIEPHTIERSGGKSKQVIDRRIT